MKLIKDQKVKWILVFLFFNFFLKSDQLVCDSNYSGEEYQVTNSSTATSFSSASFGLNLEKYVVTWVNEAQNDQASWIAGRVYDGEGNALTSIFQVNTPSGKTVGKPHVAGLGEKRFVIVWETTELQSSVIMGQAFTENGTEYQKYQNEVTIFSKTMRYGPKVVSLLGGERFAVIGHNDDSSLLTIQILESKNMTRVGGEFGANSPSNDLALLRNYDLCTIMNEEKLVYVWYNYNATVEQKYITAQISDSDGNLLQSEFQVTEFDGTDHIDPRVTGLKSGSGDYYVITWASNKNQEDGYGVFGQILQYPNTFVGEIFQVNTEQTKAETLIHQSAALPNSSRFVITWSFQSPRDFYGDAMYKMYAQKFILKENGTTKDKNYQSGHSTNDNSSLQAAKIGNQFAITRGDDLESRANSIVPIVKSNLAVAYKTSEYIASQNIRFLTPISIKKHVPNNQAFQSQGSFDYQIPNDTYTNPNPEVELTYQAYLDDHQPLPDGLHLDPEQGHFHGQVGTDDRCKNFRIIINASICEMDVLQNFTLSNSKPVVQLKIEDNVSKIGNSFKLNINKKSFFDEQDHYNLDYQAQLTNGDALPDWLLFNQPGLYFSISDNQTTSRQQYGNWGIKLIAYDQCQEPVDQIFYINFTNQAPYSLKKNPIPDQKVDFKKVTVYQIIKKDFVDPNNDTLEYSLKMENGEPLPDWVKFDKDLLKIEYHPEKEKSIGDYKLRFGISDGLLDYHTQFGVKAQKNVANKSSMPTWEIAVISSLSVVVVLILCAIVIVVKRKKNKVKKNKIKKVGNDIRIQDQNSLNTGLVTSSDTGVDDI